MKADELFGVGVRLVGLIFVIEGLPGVLGLSIAAAGQVVAALILVTQANTIVRLCYPINPRQDWQDSRDL